MMSPSEINTHTYFFRACVHVDVLQEHVIVPRTRRGLVTTIWSVGCSSGEEPATVALAAREVGGNVEILGTDINEHALDVARTGKFEERSCRNVAPQYLRWFERDGHRLVLHETIHKAITLRRHDIISDPPLRPQGNAGGWNVILCCNVLLYYGHRDKQRALAKMASVLDDDGIIIVGGSEWLSTRGSGQGTGRPSSGPRIACVTIGGVVAYGLIKESNDNPVMPTTAWRSRQGHDRGACAALAEPPQARGADVSTGGVWSPASLATQNEPGDPFFRLGNSAGATHDLGVKRTQRTQWNHDGACPTQPPARTETNPCPAATMSAQGVPHVESPKVASSIEQHRERGDRLLDAGDMLGAAEEYLQALEQDPLVVDLHLRAAVCHLDLGDVRLAEESLRRCLFLDPDLWPAALMLGDLLRDSDVAAARRYFRQAQSALETDRNTARSLDDGIGADVLTPFLVSPSVALTAIRMRLENLEVSERKERK